MLALTLIVLQDVGSKAALVPHIGGVLPILGLDDPLEVVVDLGANAHGFLERAGSHWQNHEFLHGQLVSSMRAPIDHIEGLRQETVLRTRWHEGLMARGNWRWKLDSAHQLSGLGCVIVFLRAFPSFLQNNYNAYFPVTLLKFRRNRT